MSKTISSRNDGEPYLSRHLNARGCAFGLPISGTFELTARCNFNCRMCYVHLQKNPEELRTKELSVEQWLDIAKEARDAGMVFLLLTGGEPLLRPDFPELYEKLVKLGLMISINTNASLYNETIRELFKKYPPTRINVTLYGASEKTYQNLCGNAQFERVLTNIRQMKADGLSVRLNCSITPWNRADLAGIEKISQEIGLQVKASSYMYPPVRVEGNDTPAENRLTAVEAGEALAEWKSMHEPKEMFLRHVEGVKGYLNDTETKTENSSVESDPDLGACSDPEEDCMRCRAARSSFWLKWDGEMLVCGTMGMPGVSVLKDGFSSAWEQIKKTGGQIHTPKEC